MQITARYASLAVITAKNLEHVNQIDDQQNKHKLGQ